MLGLLLISSILAADAPAPTAWLKPGDHVRSVPSAGITRKYRLHIPPGCDGSKPVPVVLAFHGAGINSLVMERYTGLNAKADAAGFVAVYPNGTGFTETIATWNAGECCGSPVQNKTDDVATVRTMLDDLATVVRVDPKRVFATGLSNGGMMCYKLASEMSDRIAAIAPVAGTMATETCNPGRPVPVIHFHGTADKIVPLAGGRRNLNTYQFHSVEHSLAAWIKADGCPAEPKVTELPNSVADGTHATRKVYGPGTNGAEVVLILIEGGGHTWPGRDARAKLLGKASKNVPANDLMWEFFSRHPMK